MFFKTRPTHVISPYLTVVNENETVGLVLEKNAYATQRITAKFKSIEQFGSRSSTALLFGLMDCRDAEANRIGG